MKRNPKISVVIPSYNKVQFIGKTFDSILRQNYSSYEIIVQDGGSTDGTFEVIQKYAKQYSNVFKIESKRDNGQTSAINIGFSKASGEIFTYINADDVYLQGAFFEIARQYQKNPQALWFAGYGKVINGKNREIAKFSTWYKNFLLSLNAKFCLLITNYLIQPSIFITKETYKKYGPFIGLTNGVVMEYGLWLKLSKVSMPVIIKKFLSAFRITEGNISSIAYKDTLKEDELIVRKYTKSKVILFLHKLHNLLRVITIKAINS